MLALADAQVAVEQLYRAGHLIQALERAERELGADPDHGRLWELKGLIHRSRGESEPARRALEAATLFVPLRPAARCALADCYAHAGRSQLAYEMYRGLFDDPQTPPELWLSIAKGLDHVGASALALSVCRSAARRDPDSPQAWHDLACYLGRCGYAPRFVLASARKAVALAPDVGRWRIGLASLLSQAEKPHEAGVVASKLSAEQLAAAECPCCVRRIAEVFDDLGDAARAELCRQRAAELDLAASSDE